MVPMNRFCFFNEIMLQQKLQYLILKYFCWHNYHSDLNVERVLVPRRGTLSYSLVSPFCNFCIMLVLAAVIPAAFLSCLIPTGEKTWRQSSMHEHFHTVETSELIGSPIIGISDFNRIGVDISGSICTYPYCNVQHSAAFCFWYQTVCATSSYDVSQWVDFLP